MSTTLRLSFPIQSKPSIQALAGAVNRAAFAVWNVLRAHAEARGRRRLLELADQMASSHPDVAAQLRRAVADA